MIRQKNDDWLLLVTIALERRIDRFERSAIQVIQLTEVGRSRVPSHGITPELFLRGRRR